MLIFLYLISTFFYEYCYGTIFACNGFLNFNTDIDVSVIKVRLFKNGNLKYENECSPLNKLYILPLFGKGEYTIKLDKPQNWNFEPNEYNILVNEIDDVCTRGENLNFTFSGYLMNGKIYSFPLSKGPSGVEIHLKLSQTKTLIMKTYTSMNGEYHFPDPILPNDYILSAYHPDINFSQNDIDIKLTSDGFIQKSDKNIVVAGYTIEGRVTSKQHGIDAPDPKTTDVRSGDTVPTSGVVFFLFQIWNHEGSELSSLLAPEHLTCSGRPILPRSALSEQESIMVTGESNDREKIDGSSSLSYLGRCVSDSNGSFAFNNVPQGRYRIVPFYHNKDVKFEVSPAYKDIKVEVEDINIIESQQLTFEILGFSVTGRVLRREQGPGLDHVNVSLGDLSALTDASGYYTFEGMHTGHYKMRLVKEHYHFEIADVFVSPNSPKLVDAYPIKYDVCGRFRSDGHFASTDTTDVAYQLIKVKYVPTDDTSNGMATTYETLLSRDKGTFCLPLPPGTYDTQVIIPSTEEFTGIKYNPETRLVKVVDKPINDLTFVRCFTKITGQIILLATECPRNENLHRYRIQLYKASSAKKNDWQPVTFMTPQLGTTSTEVDGGANAITDEVTVPPGRCTLKFEYQGALPNTPYRACIREGKGDTAPPSTTSCWTRECLEIQTVPSSESSGKIERLGESSTEPTLTFVQSGFKVQISSTHLPLPMFIRAGEGGRGDALGDLDEGSLSRLPACKSLFENEAGAIVNDVIARCQLLTSPTTLCFPAYGSYVVEPLSCYIFSSNVPNLPPDSPAVEEHSRRFMLNIANHGGEGNLKDRSIALDAQKYKLTVGVQSLARHVMASHDGNVEDDTGKICVYGVDKKGDQSLIRCQEYRFNAREITTVGDVSYFPNKTVDVDFVEYPLLNITITSKNYLFHVDHMPFQYDSQFKCSKAHVIFKMVPTLFVNGHVQPSELGVRIDLMTGENVLDTTYTNKAGKYKFGPLLNDTTYEIKATKEGYFLHKKFEDPFSFDISKISELQITVSEERSSSSVLKESDADKTNNAGNIGLPNALISISGGRDNFRALNVTGPEGTISYYGLSPGQYYVRPIMKEYNFTPPSQLVTIESGKSHYIDIMAVKAAFSVRGIVTTMNGLPMTMPTINSPTSNGRSQQKSRDTNLDDDPSTFYVEATGIALDDPLGSSGVGQRCELLKEDGKVSPLSGHFEVRALVPGCTYELRVRPPPSSTPTGSESSADRADDDEPHPKNPAFRSFPSRYVVTVSPDQNTDLTDFYRFRLMALTSTAQQVEAGLGPGTLVYGKVTLFTTKTAPNPNFTNTESDADFAHRTPSYELLEFFKISLYASTSLTTDQAPLQIKLLTSRSEFFAFDPVALDFEKYVVKLESTSALDGKVYDPLVYYKTLSANSGSVFLAFELRLREKKRLMIEDDSNKGRKEYVLFFILIMGLAIMVYGYEKVLSILITIVHQIIPTLEYILKKSSSLKTSNHAINSFDSSSSLDSLSPSTSHTSFLNYSNLKKKMKVKKS